MLVSEPIAPAGRIVWRLIASVVTVVTLLWSTTTVVSLLAFDRDEAHLVVRDAIKRVVVDATGGSVTIRGAETSGAVVDTRITRGLFSPRHRERVVDGELRVTQSCPILQIVICSVRTTMSVPRGVAVVVHATSGIVRLVGLSGSIDASSTAGGITATGLTALTVNARTSAGGLDLRFDRAPESVDARSTAGGITIVVPRDDTIYRVITQTTAGSVSQNIRTGPDGDHTIDATATAGAIRIVYPD